MLGISRLEVTTLTSESDAIFAPDNWSWRTTLFRRLFFGSTLSSTVFKIESEDLRFLKRVVSDIEESLSKPILMQTAKWFLRSSAAKKNLYLHNPMLGLANVRPLGMLKQEAGDRPGNLGWFRQRWVGGCLTIEWEQQQRLHVQASVQKYKGSVGTPRLYAWWSVCLSLCSWKQWVSNEFHISRLQPPLIQVNSWYRSSWNPRLWMGYLILSSPQKAWLQSLLGNPPNITLVQLHE